MSEILHNQLIIIGSGPAGLSAALYAARADLNPILFTGMTLHGQASLTSTIENYPGFPNGIQGDELGRLFQEQAEKFGAKVFFEEVTKVDLFSRPFVVEGYSQKYTCDSLIISTGADPKKLNIPGENKLIGTGVSYCATCDGWFFKNKDVVVVGGGDSALEEALFLTRFAHSVTVIHRRDQLRAGAILENRAKENSKIKFIWNSIVTEILGSEKVEGIKIQNSIKNTEDEIKTDGVFIFIGHSPNTQLFQGQLDMDQNGYLIVNRKMETNIPGVFAAGEIADPVYRQVITSAGMGAAAAIQATHYLENLIE